MRLETIHEHTIDLDLLSGGICIDVGCRGFQFSEAMRDLGCEVWAFDMEEMPAPEGLNFKKYAISDFNGFGIFKDTKDQQAKYLLRHFEGQAGVPVPVLRLTDVYAMIALANLKGNDIHTVDVLKIDAEGSEYAILSDPNFKPVARQLSIEFHLHCHRSLHDQYYDKCMENLLKYYVPVQHELTEAHGAGLNWWDSLFIRKDLINNHE